MSNFPCTVMPSKWKVQSTRCGVGAKPPISDVCKKRENRGKPTLLRITNTISSCHSYKEPVSEIPMNGLSLYRDGLALDPPLSSCNGCTNAEAEVRNLFDQISNSFLDNPSQFLGFEFPKSACIDCSELFHRWVQKLDSEVDCDGRFSLCPDLKRRIKALVHKLLNEREGMSSLVACGGLKRKSETLSEMLMLLKGVAASPCDQMREALEWEVQILKVRKALFLRMADISDVEEFPYRKKQRTHKFLRATSSGTANLFSKKPQMELNGGLGSYDMLNQPVRRSRRTLLKLGKCELTKKRIPVGPSFQADVPDWTSPPNKEDKSDDNNELNDSRWLGTQIWPIEGDNRQIYEGIIGKGRPDLCVCTSPGSVDCIRFHVNMARLHLKSDLGPAFFSLGFDEMGEEVSRLWTHEEQMRFDDLVRLNPSSEGKSFCEPALKYFTSKSRQGIVSFYFNVFVLRWMSIRTRVASGTVDSDDDENMG